MCTAKRMPRAENAEKSGLTICLLSARLLMDSQIEWEQRSTLRWIKDDNNGSTRVIKRLAKKEKVFKRSY